MGDIIHSDPSGTMTYAEYMTAHVIGDETITYAKMQHVSATDKVLGRSTAGAGDVEEIACTAAGRYALAGSAVSNTVYGTAWSTGTASAPSGSVLYVKFEALPAALIGTTAFGTAWNGVTGTAVSQDSAYDKFKTIDDQIAALGTAQVSDTAYGTAWNSSGTTAPSQNAVYDKIETLGSMDLSIADDSYWAHRFEMGTAGEALVFGNWVYLKPSDHKWWKAGGGSAAIAIEPLGVALGAIGTAAAGTIMRVGLYRDDSGFGGAVTDGTPAFLSTTPGEITPTAPSGAAQIIRSVGHFRSPNGTARLVEVNPDNIWVEHA